MPAHPATKTKRLHEGQDFAMNRKLRILAMVGALALPCGAAAPRAAGQAQNKPPLRLTLDDAVRLALRQNPRVAIARLEVAQSRDDRSIARSALLPQANLRASDAATRRNLEAFIGRSIPGFPQHSGPFQTFQAGPGFSVPVFDLTLWRKWQASGEAVVGSRAQEQTVREQTTLLVVSQYLGGLRAAAEVRAATSRVTLAQTLYGLAGQLQKQGIGTALDTLRANVELQNEKQLLIVAQTQLHTSLDGLVWLLNLDPHQCVELADEQSFFQTPQTDLSRSLETAYAERPEMKTLLAQQAAAHLEQRAASESRLPKIALEGNWGYQGLSAPASIPAYQYQVTLQVPLFTGGRIRAENAKAHVELEEIARQMEDLKNHIALEVKTAGHELDAARSEVEVAALGVKLARDEVNQAQERFQAGVANNLEVTSAQDALARANDNQIAALYRYNQARANLAQATGQIEKLYAP
jgi:outer membrane protein